MIAYTDIQIGVKALLALYYSHEVILLQMGRHSSVGGAVTESECQDYQVGYIF